LAFSCSNFVQAQNDEVYDLPALLEYALENSFDMQIFEKEVLLNQSELYQQKKTFYPRVDAYVNYQWYLGNLPEYWFPEDEGSVLSSGNSDGPYSVQLGLPQNLFMGVRVNQPLFDYRFTLNKEGDKLMKGLELARKRSRIEELIIKIGTSYYEYHALSGKMEMINFGIKRLTTALRVSEIRVENELAEPIELDKIKYQLAKLSIRKTELTDGLVLKTKQLQFLAGFPSDYNLKISKEDPSQLNIQSREIQTTAKSELLEASKDINQLQFQQERSANLPKLDLYADLGMQSQSEDLNFFNQEAINNVSMLGLKLHIPVYTPDKRTSEQFRIENEKVELQKDQLEYAQKLQLEKERIKISSLTEQYLQEKQLVELSDKLYEGEIERFELGLVSIKELQDAGEEYYRVSAEMLGTYYAIRISELNYLESSGHLLEFFNVTP